MTRFSVQRVSPRPPAQRHPSDRRSIRFRRTRLSVGFLFGEAQMRSESPGLKKFFGMPAQSSCETLTHSAA